MAKGRQSTTTPRAKQAPAPRVVQTNAGPNPMGPPAKQKPTSLGRVLRIGGGGGGIGGKELKKIIDTGGKNVSGGQVVQRLDKINERLAAKDKTGINLKSGAVNFLTRQAEKQGPGMDNFLGLGKSTFGTGRLGKALQGLVGTRETGGYINPQSGQQSRTPGTARTILPRGMDLMPSGRQTVRGIGKQYEVPSRLMQPSTSAGVSAGEGVGVAPGAGEEVITPTPEPLPELPPEEEQKPEDQTMFSNFDAALANWAQGFKTARSSRKRAGRQAQGLGSTRVAPSINMLGY